MDIKPINSGLEYFDDTHAFDLATGSCTPLATVGDRPSPRYKHQAFVDADYMYVIGGGSFEPEGPNLDVYRLALMEGDGGGGGGKALEWERLTPTGTPPRCRAAHGLAWDSVGRVAYIWGGFTSGMELDKTFGALRLSPPTTLAPPTRSAASAVAIPVVTATAVANTTPGELAAVGPPLSAVALVRTLPAAAAAAAAPAVSIDESQYRGDTEVVTGAYSGRATTRRRNRGALSADAAGVMVAAVAAAVARNSKPLGSSSGARGEGQGYRASASGTELAEHQRLRQEEGEEEEHEHEHHHRHHHQDEQQQQHSPPLSTGAEDARNSPGGVDGGGRWRQRSQRLWRQGPGEERGSGSEDQNYSGISRRRSRGRRNPTWGQGWATGRLQGIWGGGGSGDGGVEAGGANHAPPPPPPVAAVASTPDEVVPPQLPVVPDEAPSSRYTGAAAAAAVAGQELSWVTLSSGQGGSAAGTSGGGESLPAPSPAGRSFHCAFFHGGACYVTGGSDGSRKFGDMWRFPTRESPPPLTTLAARAFVASRGGEVAAATTTMQARKGGGSGSGGGGDGGGARVTLQSLPEELREALENINMQAEVVL